MSVFSKRAVNPLLVFSALLALARCGEQPKETKAAPTASEPGAHASAAPANRTIKTASGMEMVLVPAGEFVMGVIEGPIDAKPAHTVKVDAVLMDQYEMTQEIFEKLTGKNPSRQKNPKNPVEQVTWFVAIKFCNSRSKLEGLAPCYNEQTAECDFAANGYRLPTEAEWEHACRAGSTNRFYFSDRPEDLKANAWFDGNSQSKPHPVAHWPANAFGLYDMTGNVQEWCNDFYGVKYYRNSPAENPRGPEEGEKRVLRGGAWSSKADVCAAWARNCDEAGFTDVCLTMDSNGFRCVRRAKPEEISALAGR
ncbi:MAG TPA: SUMF1/EgtB/PvdO family nonheme iron enzyme [Verrucomicrobiae bacterium]|nr:SUMF1/EgtB/PvdO family nonheme iron enzyme [Verrucomicrobiae bacterium]